MDEVSNATGSPTARADAVGAAASTANAGHPATAAPLSARVAWVLFDWAIQPFYTLVVTFLFAPYFANVVVSDPALGQALWGYAAAAAGVVIAIGSPLLGALADGRGARKPWIALLSLVIAAAVATLWLAEPKASPTTVWLVVAAFAVATIAAEFTQVFTNAFLPSLVPKDQLGRLSGTGWAVGFTGGLVSLGVMGGLVVADPATGRTLLGLEPLLVLDVARREGDRLVGPFAAVWFLLFMIPFFLLVPDSRRRVDAPPARSPLAELGDTLRSLPGHKDMMYFLMARMLYTDGLSAIFVFGGIYGAGVFGWQALELGLFGIVLTLTGAIGALIGGVLDDRLGSKTVIVGALALMIVGALGILSVDKGHVLYVVDAVPKAAGSAPFSSIGEKVFLAFAVVIGMVAAPTQAASRSLLARLAPPDKIAQFFGLFAFSGKVTAFLAPFLVATVTATTGSQRLGMASILVFLLAGIALMTPVRARV